MTRDRLLQLATSPTVDNEKMEIAELCLAALGALDFIISATTFDDETDRAEIRLASFSHEIRCGQAVLNRVK